MANVVKAYAVLCGFWNVAAHDLRRTFAKLIHKRRPSLDQIQLSLGHTPILTTEKYLSVEQDLHDPPCDGLGLSLQSDGQE